MNLILSYKKKKIPVIVIAVAMAYKSGLANEMIVACNDINPYQKEDAWL